RGLGFDDAIVVVHFVIETERTSRLAFRIPDQLDVWRAIGNGGEIPYQIGAENAVNRRGSVAFDQQPPLLGPGGQGCARFSRRRLDAARIEDIETHLTGGPDDQ